MTNEKYRPDIDGLRAVAVLPVLCFHLRMPWISGGFVGVDVFFVISGYLIGQGILNQLSSGTFSIRDFYERRFRRIAPALFLMLLLTTVVASCFLLPKRLLGYANSLIATIGSLSNFYFLRGSGYFFGSEDVVLLHTWSLAVEEQFYLLFPLFVMLVYRANRATTGVMLAAAALASFLLNVLMLPRWPAATFYMLPPRAWELLLGVLLAKYEPLRQRSRFVSETFAATGLAMILGSMIMITGDMPFPGLRAMPPCVGSAMIIAAGIDQNTSVNRVLTWRPLVFIGLLSYSLYLFHWPVIVLSREAFNFDTEASNVCVGILAVTFALAWLSWRFVERPFRRKSAKGRSVFAYVGTAMVSGLIIATALRLSNGFPQRFSTRTNQIASYIDSGDAHFRSTKCGVNPPTWMGACLRDDGNKPSVLIVGDSYSAHLWLGLNSSYPEINFKQAALSSCRPLIDVRGYGQENCSDFMSSIFRSYVLNHPKEPVILAAQWSEKDLAQVSETLDYLKAAGIRVVLVGPPPQYKSSLPQLLAIANERDDWGVVTRGRRSDTERLDRALATLAREHDVQYVSLYQFFCTPECSTMTPNGVPLQFDRGHLTAEGSIFASLAFRAVTELSVK